MNSRLVHDDADDWNALVVIPAAARLDLIQLRDITVFLDATLAQGEDLVFPGGNHHEDVGIPMRDYLRIERPAVVPLTVETRAA